MSTAISPFLTLHTVLPLLVQEPKSIPLLSALVHLLAQAPAAPSSSTTTGLPLPTLHQARLALAKELIGQVRMAEAEAELMTAEKEARRGSPGGRWVSESRRVEWREAVGLLVRVQEELGREGRARQWRTKLEMDNRAEATQKEGLE